MCLGQVVRVENKPPGQHKGRGGVPVGKGEGDGVGFRDGQAWQGLLGWPWTCSVASIILFLKLPTVTPGDISHSQAPAQFHSANVSLCPGHA